jgi:hypothetical protein
MFFPVNAQNKKELNAVILRMKTDSTNLENQLVQKTAEFKDLEAELNAIILKLKSDFTNLEDKLSQKNTEFQNLKAESSAVILALKSDSTNLQNQLADRISVLKRLETDLQEKDLSIKEYEQNFFKLYSTIEDLQGKLKIQEEEIERIRLESRNESPESKELKDNILQLKNQLEMAKQYGAVYAFVEAFYNSLELTPEENQRQYEVGGVPFDTEMFKSLIAPNAQYSAKRVANLSDQNYHDRYYIKLLGVDEVKIEGSIIKVKATVLYSIYEMGDFYNSESLQIGNYRGILKLMEWRDLGLSKMEVLEYEHMDGFSESDFYKTIGSLNK